MSSIKSRKFHGGEHGAICNLVIKGDAVITLFLRNGDLMDPNGPSDPRTPEGPYEQPADDDAPRVSIGESDFDRPVAPSEEDQCWWIHSGYNVPKF
jgi:hypothetical protein